MRVRQVGILLLVATLVLAVPVTPALARDDAEAGAEDGKAEREGGIEGAIAGVAEANDLAGAVFVLLAGMVLLTVCVEKLISYLTRAAMRLRFSLFALAILFTGLEFDDLVLAVVFSAGGLEDAALGTAFGTALAILGLTLALTAIVTPFSLDLPTSYVLLFGAAPLVLVPFALHGSLSVVHGVVLIVAFVVAFGYLVVRELQRDVPVFRSTPVAGSARPDGGVATPELADIPEDSFVRGRSGAGWIWLSLAVVALVGVVFASMVLEAGSEVAIEGMGIGETVFGATVLTAILTFEDVMLTLEPVRRGVPEIGVGNVIGSVLFSVTANVGVIALLSELAITSSVRTFHLPALVLVTALSAAFLYRGRLERRHGVLLGGLYVVYWLVAIVSFGGVPISG